ncbi:MAG: hypothetical protein WCO51_06015 [bacterium]
MGRLNKYGIAVIAFLVSINAASWALSFQSTLESIKVEGRPGQLVNRKFQLILSKDGQRTHFKARTEDWWRSEDGKQSYYREAGILTRSCAKWVKLNPTEIDVDPEGTLSIRVSIAIPPDVKPGGYWCVLTVDETPDPLKNISGVGIRFLASVSVGIFVNITPLERSAQITDVKVMPDQASVKLCNKGNCPLGVEGRFEFLRKGESEPVTTIKIPRGTLLPEPITTGMFSANLPDIKVLPSGRYIVRVILDIGLDHFIGAQKEMDVNRDVPNPTPNK